LSGTFFKVNKHHLHIFIQDSLVWFSKPDKIPEITTKNKVYMKEMVMEGVILVERSQETRCKHSGA